ncbi:CARDB domain-containing protein [Pyxidicoccus sp. 3LG]
MQRNIGRTFVGALALASVAAGCASGDTSEESLKDARQGLGGPDFVVTALSGPTSTYPGIPFNATVTVCNQGDTGGGTEVALVLSDDSDLSISTDAWGGSVYLGYLSPGACETHSLQASPAPSEGAWYLGALADPYGLEFESDEGNNATLGGRMGVGYGPDFIVTTVMGPPSVEPSDNLTARVTVCNQGTQPGSTEVEVYLSADEFIQPSGGPGPNEDLRVGSVSVDSLYPGQCTTVPVTGPATRPPPALDGAFYLGAVVDPLHMQDELIEDNNTHAGYRLGVGWRPDFVITAVKGPTSVEPGSSLTARVTVCNQGTEGRSTDLEVYLSEDDFIQPSTAPGPQEDALLGVASTDHLVPGQCTTVPVTGGATLPYPGNDGPYHLGAVVDPFDNEEEFLEDNNTHSGYRLGVGFRPDFVVTAVKGPTSVEPSDNLPAQVTVCNHGTAPGSTEVNLYLSTDDVFQPFPGPGPMQDSLVGQASTDHLIPGQCTTVPVQGSVNLPSPGNEGPYHLGAVVDPFDNQDELIEDNNTHSGYRIGVGWRPDFVVTAVKGPTSVEPGNNLSVQVTVCNHGTSPSSTEVELYLSADDVIRPHTGPGPMEDRYMGQAPTGDLFPGQCTTVPVQGSAQLPYPGNDGPYHLGAVVDPYDNQDELIEDNNTHSGYRIGVGYRPDFVVTAVKGPTSVEPGNNLSVQVTVCNHGTSSGSTEVELYMSADDVIRPFTSSGPSEDRFVGWASTDHLSPGQCTTVPMQGSANLPYPGNDGPYHLGAVVDAFDNQDELIEDNNIHSGYRIGVGYRPDFVVTAVKGPTSVEPGNSLSVQVTVCNQGTSSGSTAVEVYLSADDVIRPFTSSGPSEDRFVGWASTDHLSPGQCTTVPMQGSANLPYPGNDGPYHLGAVVDAFDNQDELIEDNNIHSGYRIGVGYRPDFVVTAVKGPTSVEPGDNLPAQVTVCNHGTSPGSTEVELYLSVDDVIRLFTSSGPSEDRPVGQAWTDHLFPGQCTTVPVQGSAHLPYPGDYGPYHLGAVVDAYDNDDELIEDNNLHSGYRLGVGYRPDFVITAVQGPASISIQPSQSFNAQVTVCNQGTSQGYADLTLYLSVDDVIRPLTSSGPSEDSPAGWASVNDLQPGQCTTVPVQGSANLPYPGNEGPYHLGAVVDPYDNEDELIEDNNIHSGYRIGVGNRPDFVITSVTGPYSVGAGNTFSTSFIVCNRGQQSGTVDVDVYLSADATIRPQSPSLPPEDFLLGTVPGVSLNPGICANRTMSVTAPPFLPEGGYYLGAVADPTRSSQELIEDNNVFTGNRIGVGNQPDFVITSVTSANSVRMGAPLTVSVTVCNRGQAAGTTDVALVFSTDNVIRMPPPNRPPEDYHLDMIVGVALNAGQCVSRSRTVNAYAPNPGSYSLGALADMHQGVPEIIEDNNTLAGTVVSVNP